MRKQWVKQKGEKALGRGEEQIRRLIRKSASDACYKIKSRLLRK
jgi:hypothetical protein